MTSNDPKRLCVDFTLHSDTLLLAMDKDQSIDMEGCCEEVDTFMFEGKKIPKNDFT